MFWPTEGNLFHGLGTSVFENGDRSVEFDDGDVETLDLRRDLWKHCSARGLNPLPLYSEAPTVLAQMLACFGNKSFLCLSTHCFPSFVSNNAFASEENIFKKTVPVVHIHVIPESASVIASHVLYKVMHNHDGSLEIKARNVRHGNKDDIRADLASDCAMFSPVGMCIRLSKTSLHGSRVYKLGIHSAFVQTGLVARDFYVIRPKESHDRGKVLCLFLMAAYWLEKANSKW